MRLVCWHPLLTDHLAYTYGALANRVSSLRVNSWRVHDPVRGGHGWTRRSPVAGEEHVVPGSGWLGWARNILHRERDAVHLFGSPFEDRRQIAVMLMACLAGRRIALMSEPYSTSATGYFTAVISWQDRLKYRLRPFRYRAYGALIARRIDTVFAISPLACRQFAAMGVPANRIAPFGYFVPGPEREMPPARPSRTLRLVFAGSLIERKGLRTAVEAIALARARGCDVILDLYGPGNPAAWENGSTITYRGMLPFGAVAPALGEYDALILPSLFDGWGVIANEAVQAGIPVIASDAVGAGAVIAAHGCGMTFPAGHADALASRIIEWATAPERLARATDAARRTAPLLRPEVAADYMVQVLAARASGSPLPPSPWYPNPFESDL